ncbi:MAG: alpha/beta fold hydrolase [Hyphomicrobiales bacterium]
MSNDASTLSATPSAAGSTGGSLLPISRLAWTSIGRLAVRDTGSQDAEQEVIVLWPAILSDHRIYRQQINAWRDRYRLVVIDGPGHGESEAAPDTFAMARCGEAISEVLDFLGIRKPVIAIGTSWGGLAAGEFAIAHPDRVRALVMLNTPVDTKSDGPGFGDRFIVWGARWIHTSGIYREGVAKAFFLPATRERGGEMLRDFHQHLREADGASLARSVRSVLVDRDPIAPRMHMITAPTLFVAGRHDAMYPLADLRRAAAVLPRGRFEAIDSAHISVVDAPDQATALIDDFLQHA